MTATSPTRVRRVVAEALKFGTVGLIALVFDIGIFNILLAGPLSSHPLTCKVISVSVATVVAYIGNRFWSFKARARSGYGREFVMFFVLNGIAMAISVGVLAISHYTLGLTSRLDDNIAANIIGLGLGTLFRFWAYRKWVFREYPEADALTAELREPV